MAKAVLGIDVGGSTTKIVGFRKEKEGHHPSFLYLETTRTRHTNTTANSI